MFALLLPVLVGTKWALMPSVATKQVNRPERVIKPRLALTCVVFVLLVLNLVAALQVELGGVWVTQNRLVRTGVTMARLFGSVSLN